MLHFAFQAPNKPSPTPLIPHFTSSPRLQTHWAPCCSLQGSTRCLGWAPPPAPLAGMLLPQPPRVLPSPPPPPRAGSAHVQTPPKQQACSPVPLLGLVSHRGVSLPSGSSLPEGSHLQGTDDSHTCKRSRRNENHPIGVSQLE